MSKKVAEGTGSLLLDVKVGSGAFMTGLGQARLLGQTMISIGKAHGVATAAMLTGMDTPLGRGQTLGTVTAWRDGIIRRLDAKAVGMASWRLGAGRSRPAETVSATARVICHAKPGEHVTNGQPIPELLGDDPARLDAARTELGTAIDIGDQPPPARPLILERIGF